MLLVLFRGTPLVGGANTFPPALPGTLWVLGGVPYDFKGKHREAYSVPCIGWQANVICRGATAT